MNEIRSKLSRRHVVAGAGAAGAAAVAAAVLSPKRLTPTAPPESASKVPAQDGGGYRESEHVLHYYRTTRI
jgi:hypothetical protein